MGKCTKDNFQKRGLQDDKIFKEIISRVTFNTIVTEAASTLLHCLPELAATKLLKNPVHAKKLPLAH